MRGGGEERGVRDDGCDGRGEETTGAAERAPTMEDSWDDPESSAWCAEDVGAEALSAELDAMLMSVDSKASSSARAIEAEAKARGETRRATAADRGGTKAGATRDAYDDACSKQFVEYYLLADVEPRGTRAMSGKETAAARRFLARHAEAAARRATSARHRRERKGRQRMDGRVVRARRGDERG